MTQSNLEHTADRVRAALVDRWRKDIFHVEAIERQNLITVSYSGRPGVGAVWGHASLSTDVIDASTGAYIDYAKVEVQRIDPASGSAEHHPGTADYQWPALAL